MISAIRSEMGRYYYNKKITVEEAYDLTVFQLKQYGVLRAGYHTSTIITWVNSHSGKENSVGVEVNLMDEPYVRIKYTQINQDGQKYDHSQKIGLTITRCYYGGTRYWFTCPNCSNRVGCIYLTGREDHFKCRKCNNLTYHSRNRCVMAALGHTSRQKEKIRSEIKRWTWSGKPTRKVRKLRALELKEGLLANQAWKRIEKLKT